MVTHFIGRRLFNVLRVGRQGRSCSEIGNQHTETGKRGGRVHFIFTPGKKDGEKEKQMRAKGDTPGERKKKDWILIFLSFLLILGRKHGIIGKVDSILMIKMRKNYKKYKNGDWILYVLQSLLI